MVPCVGAIVHDRGGRLLLIRRGHAPHAGSWSLPGGRVEAGETPEQAVEREVREETGLEVRAGAPVGRVQIQGDGVVYDVLDLACTLAPPRRAIRSQATTPRRWSSPTPRPSTGWPCTPLLVETLRGWGVLPG